MAKKAAKTAAKKAPRRATPKAAKPVRASGMSAGLDQDVTETTDAQLGSQIRMICSMGGTATLYRKDGKLWLHE